MSRPEVQDAGSRSWADWGRHGRGAVSAAFVLWVLAACNGSSGGSPGLGEPAPNPLALGGEAGGGAEGTFSFANTGRADLTFEVSVSPASARAWLQLTPAEGVVAPGETRAVSVSAACPAEGGAFTAVVTVDADDPHMPSRSLDVQLACDAPPPAELICEEIPAEPGPTLRCELDGGRMIATVPWQGRSVVAASRPLDGLGGLPNDADSGFRPLAPWPLVRFEVRDAGTHAAVERFDPPMALYVAYDDEEFASATPRLDEGELGLGVWDVERERWIVVGHGVFHQGFWVADPVGDARLTLQGEASTRRPRFQMLGTPSGGEAVALIATGPSELPLAWGAMPPDPDHMLKTFDEGCVTLSGYGSGYVECVSSGDQAGLTVRVPFQEHGTVTPRVVALPWNKEGTFTDTEVDPGEFDDDVTELDRRLMNFLVVDADSPTRVLTTFDPPMEFEVLYTEEDKDPDTRSVLRLNYWDEYTERFVVLGEGPTSACIGEDGSPNPGCLWGSPVAGGATTDPAYDGLFFRADDEGSGGGLAKFTFDLWGDRMVAFGR